MKLGIIVDSSCGLTQAEAEKKGWKFVPIIVTINNKEYRDGIDITAEKYYEIINIDMDIKTATTPLGELNATLKEITTQFDYVIVYPLSMELSAQTNNFLKVAKDFTNVFVVPSKSVGFAIVSDCEILQKMAEKGSGWEEIKNHALELTNNFYGLAAPQTMKWLVKGGRVTGTTASMAKLLKIVPIIQILNGKLSKWGKGRIFEKTVERMAKFLSCDFKTSDYKFSIYHGGNKNIKELVKEIEQYVPIDKVSFFPPVIGSHIGPGVVAIVVHLKN